MVVQASDPKPRFARTAYTGLINENQKPPVLIIDLTTSDEQNRRIVQYKIISGNEGELLNEFPSFPFAVCL